MLDSTRTLGKAPLGTVITVAPGDHACTATGDRVREVRIHVGPGEVTEVDLVAAPETQPSQADETYRPSAGYIVPAILGGAGLVSLGFGIGFALDSQSNHDAAVAQQGACAAPSSPACATARSLHDAQTTSAAVSVVTYVAGGVLVAAGVVSFFVWPASTRVRVVPSVGPQGAGVFLQGNF